LNNLYLTGRPDPFISAFLKFGLSGSHDWRAYSSNSKARCQGIFRSRRERKILHFPKKDWNLRMSNLDLKATTGARRRGGSRTAPAKSPLEGGFGFTPIAES
jgi:hypothetical protein